jgi:hypothetical protein
LLYVISRLSSIADQLVKWAPGIIERASGDGPEQAEAEKNMLEDFVYWLRTADRQLDSRHLVSNAILVRRRGQWSEQLGKFFAYKSGFLLECLILSFNLRTASKLSASMKQALRLLPSAWGNSILSIMQSSTGGSDMMASAATLSRARLTIDISFMLLMRGRFDALTSEEKPPVCFVLADSSPQAGRNWLLSEVQWISGGSLGTAARSAKSMMRNVVRSFDDSRLYDDLLHQVQ